MIRQTILVGSMVRRFKKEVAKQSGVSTSGWSVMPNDTLWVACEKAVRLCEENQWDATMFVMSRFVILGPWAIKKLGVKSLPIRFLCKPRAEEIYIQYEEMLKDKYRESYKDYEKEVDEIAICQLTDGVYRAKKLKLKPKEYLDNRGWLGFFFLASDDDFMDLVINDSIDFDDVPYEVKQIWKNMDDKKDGEEYSRNLRRMRRKAERRAGV